VVVGDAEGPQLITAYDAELLSGQLAQARHEVEHLRASSHATQGAAGGVVGAWAPYTALGTTRCALAEVDLAECCDI
jgi:hypothetical protein